MTPVIVAAALVAGALGALARFGVTRAMAARFPDRLPRAVLIVNIVGSLIAGLLIGGVSGGPADLRYILVGGFAGGLTTFSTWAVETVQQVLDRRTAAALRSVGANLVGGLAAGILGMAVTFWLGV